MRGYIVADVEIHDQEAYAEYRAGVLDSLVPFGGRFLVRGGTWEPLEGDWQPGRLVVLEFPSVEQARAWYESDAYRALRDLRRRISRGNLVLVEGWEG